VERGCDRAYLVQRQQVELEAPRDAERARPIAPLGETEVDLTRERQLARPLVLGSGVRRPAVDVLVILRAARVAEAFHRPGADARGDDAVGGGQQTHPAPRMTGGERPSGGKVKPALYAEQLHNVVRVMVGKIIGHELEWPAGFGLHGLAQARGEFG
jgi:hypothetical protein